MRIFIALFMFAALAACGTAPKPTTGSTQHNGPQEAQAAKPMMPYQFFRILFAAMSAADRSVLVGAMEYDNAQMMTVTGSDNFKFWSLLAQYGWMQELPLTGGLENLPEKVDSSLWEITPEGRKYLNRYLERLRAEALPQA